MLFSTNLQENIMFSYNLVVRIMFSYKLVVRTYRFNGPSNLGG
jgi:hypothetical protein